MLSHELRPGDDAIMLMTNEQHPAKLYEKQILGTCLVLFLFIGVWETALLREPYSWLILPLGCSWCLVYRCHDGRASNDKADPLLPCCISWSVCIARTLERSVGSRCWLSHLESSRLSFGSVLGQPRKLLGTCPVCYRSGWRARSMSSSTQFAIRPSWAAGSQ